MKSWLSKIFRLEVSTTTGLVLGDIILDSVLDGKVSDRGDVVKPDILSTRSLGAVF